MPKVPKAKHTSQAMKARSLDPRHVNVSFREALSLSTSDADMQKFTGIKKALRELVERHYDYNLSEKEQRDDMREAFAAEISKTMPQLHATEQTRKETDAYVARHFTNVSWLFRSRKSAPRKDPNKRLALEDDKDDAEDIAISAPRHPGRAQPDLSSGDARDMPQTNGSRNETGGPMVEYDKDKDVDAPVNVSNRRRPGRPRKKKTTAKHTTGMCQGHPTLDEGEVSMCSTPLSSATDSLQSPTTDSPPFYTTHSEEPEESIRQFLRSCMPNLEHLLPVFIRIGLEKRRDLEGALHWPAKERMSWLMELSNEEWGISRMNVKSLSLAFDVTEQYEATLFAMGADK